MNKPFYRIGQIVPSSNTTMETEVPAMFRARETIAPERFTFHSSRMRMMKVNKEELAAMDAQADRCAAELSDAAVDVIGYACLVAIMSMGKGYHRESEEKLTRIAAAGHPSTQVVTSAGALLNGIQALGARKVSIVTPYMKPLTRLVVDYIEAEGVEVVDAISLEIDDNRAVGNRDPLALVDIADKLEIRGADAVVLSACVQMPSLAAVPAVEARLGLPVLSAAVATTYTMLQRLGLERKVPQAGALLSGAY
ncbi:MAG: Asp/Glu racemase [Pigmentiphaga sp.]|uniref:maleate cis-trans isomerase family protein n=1 Tax=Pigmentiphaga sp. TaxID=1977564 RepID=UPI0029A547FA|nr:Asp/Glu racemase [Pigmentiphaga sp.]MDX3906057.1 Asp/Glu racemase [Pigmentiphaga sp.]